MNEGMLEESHEIVIMCRIYILIQVVNVVIGSVKWEFSGPIYKI